MNVAGNQGVSRETMHILQNMMHEVNLFVALLKSMEELSSEREGGLEDIRMVFRAENAPDLRRYNAPTADEAGVLIVSGDDESDLEPRNRDIVLRFKGVGGNDGLSRINELDQHYDALHYVLMFPFGDPGWNINIKSYNPNMMEIDEPVAVDQVYKAEIFVMQYYSSRLMLRPNANTPVNEQVSIHSFGKFNQKALRAEVYSGLADVIRLDDNDMSEVGKRVILPSSFVGGPRFMAQLFQDTMNLVRRFGKPDLFITFTCNPDWPEIAEALLSVLRKVVAYCYTIEFQKHGLTHCHMLFILAEEDKSRTAEQIDHIVSAEIPDPVDYPLAHQNVTTSMVHGPCGLLNPETICMKNGLCSKKHPFNYADRTLLSEESENDKLTYRRRVMPSRLVMRNSGRTTVDNRWIVPHNLYLTAKYNAHINVEICNEINSIKYVYKYVYKGHDRAQVYMTNTAGVAEGQDEVKNFLDARYVSASEVCWRLLGYPMHKEFSSCQRLDVHLPNEQRIYYKENGRPVEALNRAVQDTTLTAWFKYNADNERYEEAMQTLYPNFCERYTFHSTPRGNYWAPRRAGFGDTIGRMYTTSPKGIEKYHLCLILLTVPGAKSLPDFRTINGEVLNTFQSAARSTVLLADDTEWSAAMTEAALTQMPSSLRQLFSASYCI
ncbi:hypothetical protein [Parasitella parasitica]|uniref:Helitron helicase-like domain-containing protein n=1 Tax=Parasitella parasitica TaxID=35722 RepID=A0A0B7NHG3_9FUNG|nr:hypothetical protein [Parasitella parasitica]